MSLKLLSLNLHRNQVAYSYGVFTCHGGRVTLKGCWEGTRNVVCVYIDCLYNIPHVWQRMALVGGGRKFN